MLRKLALTIVVSSMAAPAAMAQEGAFELSAGAGYTLSDGVTFAGVPVHGDVFNSIEPKDSFSFNATLGYFVQDDGLIEFIWSRQKSSLELGGTRILDLGDLNIDNYMGQFAWHFNDSDEPVRPYISLGLGWTRYGSVSFTDEDGDPRQTNGKSRFSGALGAGVKIYPGSGNVGLKLAFRWTPTYIKSDPGGIWCDPYWGCFQTANPQYSNQFVPIARYAAPPNSRTTAWRSALE